MVQKSRRNFLSFLGKATALTGVASIVGHSAMAAEPKKGFLHHVYFWLKNPESAQDKAALIKGLKKLSAVKTIKEYHIGVPADTNREVIDSSYAVSWLLVFKNKADQDSYQTDPIHLKFIEENSTLWDKVIVYDSESV